jgi:hypothetical protein
MKPKVGQRWLYTKVGQRWLYTVGSHSITIQEITKVHSNGNYCNLLCVGVISAYYFSLDKVGAIDSAWLGAEDRFKYLPNQDKANEI